ncbi:hypothetical protein R1flu_029241 [Riccia fluitans]|uniref:Uncharacterized protein n=1 Tax=Riccia fluitans TaxID=41844 RepID=A0ABD1XPM1_9MARC
MTRILARESSKKEAQGRVEVELKKSKEELKALQVEHRLEDTIPEEPSTRELMNRLAHRCNAANAQKVEQYWQTMLLQEELSQARTGPSSPQIKHGTDRALTRSEVKDAKVLAQPTSPN